MSPFEWHPLTVALVGLAIAAGNLALRIAALGIIPGNRKPSTGMAWLLAVLLVPFLGLIAFWLFGRTRLERRRRDVQRAASERIVDATRELPPLQLEEQLPAYVRSVASLNRHLTALPLLPGNRVQVIEDYQGSIVAMTEAVSAAEDYVHVEFYITAWDEMTAPLFEAMVAATRRGVTVRLLFDHLGSRGIPGHKEMLARLEQTDIQWHRLLPVRPRHGQFRRPDLRNHRKLLVVDGHLGFTGSQNLIEPGYNKPKHHAAGRSWVELMVRLHGPIVAELDAVFATDWLSETDEALPVPILQASIPPASIPPAPIQSAPIQSAPQPTKPARPAEGSELLPDVPCQLVPSGPGYDTENNLRMFTTLIYGATRRVSITSPYFVPDESLLYAATTAAQRGVEVELFVSEQSDQFMVGHAQASYYQALLEAGVAIHLYPAPLVLHSKHFTIDDHVAVIGSSNMDLRSFALNYEISLMLLGAPVVSRFRRVEDVYRERSRTLTLADWDRRPARRKYVDNIMRLTSALQ